MSTWCLLTAPEFWQGSPHATLKKRQMLLFQFNWKKKKKKGIMLLCILMLAIANSQCSCWGTHQL